MDEGTIENYFHELEQIWKKIEQVHRMYHKIWSERIDIYQKIVVWGKDGQGGFLRLAKKKYLIEEDHHHIGRLDHINKREKKILRILQHNKQQTNDAKNKLTHLFKETKVGGKSLYELSNAHLLDGMEDILTHYQEHTIHLQKKFIHIEREFIDDPNWENFSKTYCAMGKLIKELSRIQDHYDKKSNSYRHSMNISEAAERFSRALEEKRTKQLRLRDVKAYHHIRKVQRALKPFCSKKGAVPFGNMRHRVSYVVAFLPEHTMSMIIDLVVIGPLAFSLISKIWGTPNLSMDIGVAEIDFYIATVGMLGFALSASLGIGKYSIEIPKKFLVKLRRKYGTCNPLNFDCTQKIVPQH